MTRSLGSLPRFLRYLTTRPDAASVVLALASGPLAPFAPMGVLLWRVEDDALVCVAQTGLTASEASRYTVVPAAIDSRMWRAVRTDSVIVTHIVGDDVAVSPSQLAELDREHWSAFLARVQGRSVVRSPIRYAGRTVGGIGIITGVPWPGTDATADLLRCASDAVALWMTSSTHELDAVVAANRSRARHLSLEFTERQLEILRYVERDEPNSLIARRLHVSESSVKQDLQHVMRALNTRSRAAAARLARDLGLL